MPVGAGTRLSKDLNGVPDPREHLNVALALALNKRWEEACVEFEAAVRAGLRELLARWEGTPNVALITTDGFLYPNAELETRGIMHRKGFPESYDRMALLKFVADVKSGLPSVSVTRPM